MRRHSGGLNAKGLKAPLAFKGHLIWRLLRVTFYYPNGLIPHVGADLEGLLGGANVCHSSEEMEDHQFSITPPLLIAY